MTRPRPALSAASWGALWGVTLGFWLLGPRVATVLRVSPANLQEASVFGASLAVLFGVIGAFVGFETGLLLVVGERVRRRPIADLRAAFAVATPPLLVAGYLGNALLIEQIAFGRIMGLADERELGVAFAICLGTSVLAPLVYRRLGTRRWRRPTVIVLGALALAGALAVPWRIDPAALPSAVAAPPLARRATTTSAPLLFIGIDSANWRVLERLIADGKAPFFASLQASGASGDVRAEWPPFWSGPAWAAIVTGHPPEETGVHDDLFARAPAGPIMAFPLTADLLLAPILQLQTALVAGGVLAIEKPPRAILRRDPFWEMATRAGARTAVVRFYFTHPARGEASYVVSDRAGTDQWAPMGIVPGAGPDLAFPPEATGFLLEPFAAKDLPNPRLLAEVLPEGDHPRPPDALVDPVEILGLALRSDDRVLAASERLLRREPDLDLLVLYLGGFDIVCHVFWPYRFPEDFPESPPAPDDRRVLGPVVDRYLEFLDRRLATIVAAFPRRPNVLVVADHGAEASRGRTNWPGWHSERGGVFLLAGPSVPRREGRRELSYFDVTPTALALLGFRAPWLERGTTWVP